MGKKIQGNALISNRRREKMRRCAKLVKKGKENIGKRKRKRGKGVRVCGIGEKRQGNGGSSNRRQ